VETAPLLKSRVPDPRAKSIEHDEQISKPYYVSGIVQGVGYRYFAERAAKWLKLAGYTRNLRDGRVEVYAVGTTASLAALRRELERGPSGASVTNVAEEDTPLDANFADGFSIEYDA
jgi:acylphosphatase